MTNVFPKADPVAVAAQQAANEVYATPNPAPVAPQAPVAPTQALQPVAAPVAQATVYDFQQASDDIQKWDHLNAEIKRLSKLETELREKLDKSNLFDATKAKGSQRFTLGAGWYLSSVRPEYVKVKNDNNEVTHAIMRLKALGEAQSKRAEELFKFKVDLSGTTYKELSAEEKAIVDPLITRTPGKTQLKLVPPKPKKEK